MFGGHFYSFTGVDIDGRSQTVIQPSLRVFLDGFI